MEIEKYLPLDQFPEVKDIVNNIKDKLKCRFSIRDYAVDHTERTTINMFVIPELFSLFCEKKK